ncbi:MAG: response regulator [Spirochaetales bacterium]|nr:response regulator [Spirochaetales bacterium]
MKFLIVDDSRIMRNIIKDVIDRMKLENIEFREAQDGIEAFRMLVENDIDILFLDWNMPHVNGLELVVQLRANEKYKNLPIIMITSEASKYNVIEAIKEGVDDYIIKPIDEVIFIKKLQRLFKKLNM